MLIPSERFQKMLRAKQKLEMIISKGIRPRSCVTFSPAMLYNKYSGAKKVKDWIYPTLGVCRMVRVQDEEMRSLTLWRHTQFPRTVLIIKA